MDSQWEGQELRLWVAVIILGVVLFVGFFAWLWSEDKSQEPKRS